MKFYLFVCCLFGLSASAQTVSENRIGYVSDFPFFVESDLYMPDVITYYPNDFVQIRLPILSPHVKIGIPSDTITYSVIHKVDYQKKKIIVIPEVDYAIESIGPGHIKWHRVRSNDVGPGSKYLIDTSLNEGETLRINFRTTGGQIFQSIEIQRERIIPTINLFRATGNNDTTKKNLRAATITQKEYSEGFTEQKGQTLQIKPGHFLELIFRSHSLNDDSSILYRLSQDQNDGDWQRTGHFTLLRNLKSNTTYDLEVKYKGNDPINKYEIKILPYWYQTPFAISGFIILTSLIIVMVSFIQLRLKWAREKRKKEQMQYKLKAVQAQLNPHFIFNALNSIQSLVNNDQKQEANQYLTNFSGVLRGALKNSDAIFISFAEELELLKNYLEIEKLRFQFSYEFVIDEALRPGEIDIPPMLFQPTIENAIKHGIGGKGIKGVIRIKITGQKNGFSVCIFDNGRWHNGPVNNGYGIGLTKDRIAAINEMNKERAIEYEINISAEGTDVCFKFNNWFL